MPLSIAATTARAHEVDADLVVVGLYEDKSLTAAAAELDRATGGLVTRLIESGDLSGKAGKVGKLVGLAGPKASRALVVGLGEAASLDGPRYAKAVGDAMRAARALPAPRLVSYLTEVAVKGRDGAWTTRQHALVADRAAYKYTATVKPKGNGAGYTEVQLAGADAPAIAVAAAIAEGVNFACELGNLPPNRCNPAWMAAQAKTIADSASDKVTLTVLERDAMAELGMGALLGVAQGSANPPKLIALEYKGGAEGAAPIALVGKGITFDTGGISIKPAASMEEMKYDMMGGASVMGAFLAAVRMALPINLVCVVPAVENMPDGNSYRPGDVVTTMSGQTVEVVNTDAEGRLILCDALTWVQRYKPSAIVDAATLTGACVVALGKHAHGLMTKHDDLAAELTAAGEATLDRAWRLPLWDDYQPQIDSAFADMANVGGKNGGAITAGCFLARYTEGQRWAHLDIAGTAWDEGRKGMATGRPVYLLAQWLIDRA